MSEEKNTMTLPYSYHTFIFPFLWNDSGRVSLKKFSQCRHKCFESDMRVDKPMDPAEYARYCYFNQAARNAIYTEVGEDNPVVKNYRFNMDKFQGLQGWLDSRKGADNPVRYVIDKDIYAYNPQTRQDEFSEHFHAALRVNGIRLRLYSTGVGMIVFELENYEFRDERRITLINEFGRRVFMPFVNQKGQCKLCADTITLEYPGGSVSGPVSGTVPENNSDLRLMRPILFLLENDGYSITTNPVCSEKEFYIEPIIDDRMFVACYWRDQDGYVAELCQWEEDDYRCFTDAITKNPSDKEKNYARRLYELMFVDGDGLSCHSRTMLRQMLEEHVYQRWIEYGTITGITEYSLITVSGFDGNIDPFLSMYIEMAMLVLAQRSSLLAFERQISDCARGKLRIDDIQREYVLFQSKLLLREITPQQQGIELYNMLLKNLFIDGMQGDVENQINALFALERDASDRSDNLVLSALAILGVFDAADYLTGGPSIQSMILSASVIAVLVVLFLRNHRNRLK